MEVTLDRLAGIIEEAKKGMAGGNFARAFELAGSVRQDLERFYPGITGS
jgi:hypothetical protein